MSDESSKKLLIITSETGGGHTSAATAIADGLKRFAAPDCLVNVVRALEESHLLAQKLAGSAPPKKTVGMKVLRIGA